MQHFHETPLALRPVRDPFVGAVIVTEDIGLFSHLFADCRHLKNACAFLPRLSLSSLHVTRMLMKVYTSHVANEGEAVKMSQTALSTTTGPSLIRTFHMRKPQSELIGSSDVIREIAEEIGCAARSDAKVLISGESGVGKKVVARLIHERSRRGQSRLVPINCAGVPDSVLESELFGDLRGSVTGAHRDTGAGSSRLTVGRSSWTRSAR